jgi:hypothetical protein
MAEDDGDDPKPAGPMSETKDRRLDGTPKPPIPGPWRKGLDPSRIAFRMTVDARKSFPAPPGGWPPDEDNVLPFKAPEEPWSLPGDEALWRKFRALPVSGGPPEKDSPEEPELQEAPPNVWKGIMDAARGGKADDTPAPSEDLDENGTPSGSSKDEP